MAQGAIERPLRMKKFLRHEGSKNRRTGLLLSWL